MKVIIFLAIIASISATTLKCQFKRNLVFGYVCEIRDVVLAQGTVDVTIEHAGHQKDKTDADVKMVSFITSTVNHVPNEIFTIFPNIEILDLLDSKMTKWNRDFIKNAKSLKRIWLAKNDIEELGDNSFLGATGLENLVLHNNKITKISDKAFNGLLQLKSLELQNNLIEKLAGNIFTPLKKLTELNLSQNMIMKIDENSFSGCSKLEFLNLEQNNITVLPENVFNSQPNLTVVYLQKNQIEKLPTGLFSGCSTLMELRLDDNHLKEIPSALFETNKKFKLLNVMNNLIETFDGKILPEGMELLHIDENVATVNMPEKLEIFQAEKPDASLWTEQETSQQTTTADK